MPRRFPPDRPEEEEKDSLNEETPGDNQNSERNRNRDTFDQPQGNRPGMPETEEQKERKKNAPEKNESFKGGVV